MNINKSAYVGNKDNIFYIKDFKLYCIKIKDINKFKVSVRDIENFTIRPNNVAVNAGTEYKITATCSQLVCGNTVMQYKGKFENLQEVLNSNNI